MRRRRMRMKTHTFLAMCLALVILPPRALASGEARERGAMRTLTRELVAELQAAGVSIGDGAYGPLNQVTVVSAAAWEDLVPGRTSWDLGSSSRIQLSPPSETRLVMPLGLPNGAYVSSICASVYDIDGTDVRLALAGSDHDGTPSTF